MSETHVGGFSLADNFRKKGWLFGGRGPIILGRLVAPPNNQRSADVQRGVLTSRSICEGFPAQNARHRRESSLWDVGVVVGLVNRVRPGGIRLASEESHLEN